MLHISTAHKSSDDDVKSSSRSSSSGTLLIVNPASREPDAWPLPIPWSQPQWEIVRRRFDESELNTYYSNKDQAA